MDFEHFTKIKSIRSERLKTGFPDLDWIYGSDNKSGEYGAPRGAMALWGGSPGVGKTRACVSVCKNVLNRGRVLFFTLEMSKGQFVAKYCKGVPESQEFFISEEKSLDKETAIVAHLKPDLVVVDSVNEMVQYRLGRGAQEIREKYLAVIGDTASHVIFISQLNAEGKVKGGTYLPHMVDVVFKILPFDVEIDNDLFVICCEDKNRYGKTGGETYWAHLDKGAVCQGSNKPDVKEAVGLIKEVFRGKASWFNRMFSIS